MSLELPVLDLTGLSVQVIAALLVPALSIAVVSFTDVMITSRAFAGEAMPNASSEMRALAATQFATGVAGGYPMSASSSRTALAYASRSTTRFYSVFVVVVVVAGPLLLPGVIAAVPVAALAGVIVYAALTLLQPREWILLARFRFSEVAIAAACAVSVVFFGILPGVLIAIALSITEFIARLARPHEAVLGFVQYKAGMHDIDDHDAATTIPGLLVFPLRRTPVLPERVRLLLQGLGRSRTGYPGGDPEHGGQRRTRHHGAERPGAVARQVGRRSHRLMAGPGQERRPHPDEEPRGGSGDR
mgnify:CR=1 FL=1